MRRSLATTACATAGVILVTAFTAAGWFIHSDRPTGAVTETIVAIPDGATAVDIAGILDEAGVIRSRMLFRLVSRWEDYDTEFKAGDHAIAGDLSVRAVARALTGKALPPADVRVTIPEGLTSREIAARVAAQTTIDSTVFVRLCDDSEFASELGVDKPSLEGYLYPDTYFIRPESGPENLIRRMVTRFGEVFGDSLRARADSIGMTVDEVVTLASIIESEAGKDGEPAIVSQVFHRRLDLRRPLEANATIQYALGERRRVLWEDLEIDSPYNTYTHRGLPPGPIGNPGRGALEAALWPADTDYLYFMADGEGGHIFSRSLTEHSRAVQQYQALRRQQRAGE